MTPLELVKLSAEYFGRHGIASPRLDAELLLAHVLGVGRMDLYLQFEREVASADRDQLRELVRRRATERVPVAYLTGVREFWSRRLRVTPDVLIPRPETEGLVELVRELEPRPERIADVGTGSGAVAVAIALELPSVSLVAVDVSAAATEVAAANLAALDLSGRVTTACGDGLDPLEGDFDAIVSNPPYVPTAELAGLAPEVGHEPRTALDGGPDGLDFIRYLCREAPARLRRPGHLVVEVGAGQAPAVERLMAEAGADRSWVRKDLAGIERVVAGRWGE